MRIDQLIPEAAARLISEALLLLAPDGSIIDANESALACYGYSRDEIESRRLSDLETSSASGTVPTLREATESGATRQIEHVRSNGAHFPVEMKASSVTVAGEAAVLASVRDLSARSAAEKALQETNERLRAVIDHTNEGIFILGPDANIVWCNDEMGRMHGYATSEMLPTDLAALDTDEPAQLAPERLQRAFAGEPLRFETEHHLKGGGTIPLEVTTRLVVLGGKKYVVAYHRDISVRNRATTALKDREHWLNESQRIARLGHYVYHLEADRWEGSPALYDVLGIEQSGDRDFAAWLAVVHPEDRKWVAKFITTEALDGPAPFDIECRITRPRDGETRWVQTSGKVEYGEDGAPTRMYGTIQDITERHRFISELRRVEADMRMLNEDLAGRVEERAVLLRRLSDMVTSVIDVVDSVSEMRDPYTAGHQRRVAELAVAIARELGMNEADVDDIRVAGMMHDIGKMSVPAEILSKPSELSETELCLIQGHAEAGYNIIAAAQMQGPIAELIRQHHERCDGSGYPRGLTGDELLAGSKVIMVADVVESMMSHRPYRAALGAEVALGEIERGAGTSFDPDVVAACLRLFREQGFSLFNE